MSIFDGTEPADTSPKWETEEAAREIVKRAAQIRRTSEPFDLHAIIVALLEHMETKQ